MIYRLLDEQAFPADFQETFTTPGAAKNYTHRLKHLPSTTASPTVTFISGVTSNPLINFFLVDNVPAAPGEVLLKLETGDLIFYTLDGNAPSSIVVSYKAAGTLASVDPINEIFCWLNMQRFIFGVPKLSVAGDRPIASFLLPTGVADLVTIKRLTVSAQSLSLLDENPTTTTQLAVTTGEFAAYAAGVNGVDISLHNTGWGTGNNEGWYRNTASVNLPVNISAANVWLNVFCLANAAQHANITLEIGAV